MECWSSMRCTARRASSGCSPYSMFSALIAFARRPPGLRRLSTPSSKHTAFFAFADWKSTGASAGAFR